YLYSLIVAAAATVCCLNLGIFWTGLLRQPLFLWAYLFIAIGCVAAFFCLSFRNKKVLIVSGGIGVLLGAMTIAMNQLWPPDRTAVAIQQHARLIYTQIAASGCNRDVTDDGIAGLVLRGRVEDVKLASDNERSVVISIQKTSES